MDEKLVAQLRKVYGFLEDITPETRDFPAWTIEKGIPHQSWAGEHPRIEFKVEVDLTGGMDVSVLRDLSWKIEKTLRNSLQKETFSSPADVRKVYESSGIGLTLKKFDLLEPSQQDTLKILEGPCGVIRNTCIAFERDVLHKVYAAGKLNDAYIWVGDVGSPEEVSFLDPKGFYLRPPILLDFLCGKNTAGGPEEFGFSYTVELGKDELAFNLMDMEYSPKSKVLTIGDWGLWKREKGVLKYLNPQPPAEQKINENSPLLKLLEAYRRF